MEFQCLTEQTGTSRSIRRKCYNGETQMAKQPLGKAADSSQLSALAGQAKAAWERRQPAFEDDILFTKMKLKAGD